MGTKKIYAALIAAALLPAAIVPAPAQTGWWPFGGGPPPREPAYRPPPPHHPQAGGPRPAICLHLEQRLAQESTRGVQSREQLPKIEAEVRQLDRQVRSAEIQLERADCYDQFLFSRTLRRTRQCIELHNQFETARRRLADLDAQRQQILGSSGRSHQDEIIRELARNNCGASYQQEAARHGGGGFSFFDEDEDKGSGSRFATLPFATYRTLCVRLCDGYYFPVSFSTLPEHFDRDADVCKSKCAAPAELYYHRNPGEAVDQAVSYAAKQPYTGLDVAFRYRKEFVNGCSCKQAEYVPSTPVFKKRAEGPVPRPPSEPKR